MRYDFCDIAVGRSKKGKVKVTVGKHHGRAGGGVKPVNCERLIESARQRTHPLRKTFLIV